MKSGEDPLATGNYSNATTSKTDHAFTTILHLTPVTAYAPKPYYPNATTEAITRFNVIDARPRDVYQTPLPVSRTNAPSKTWDPVVPTPTTKWTDVPKLWQTLDRSVAAQTTTVDVWTKVMGAAWKNALDAGDPLISKAPENLMKGFDAYVMAVPLTTDFA
jgi:hypothetical protein